MNFETIRYSTANNIATITLNRPEQKNSIHLTMHHELYDAFEAAKQDNEVKVILLQGSGDSFSAGADLKSIPMGEIGTFDYGNYLRDTYNRLILHIASIDKPIVAYLNGLAVGAGLSIALACDFRIANSNAQFGLGFLKIGLVPDAGASYFLPRLIGMGKALEFSLGEMVSADKALQIGLINRIGEPDEFVQQLTRVPLTAFALTKQNMRKSYEHSLAEVLEAEVTSQRKAGTTKEHITAIEQFVGKSQKH